MPIDPLESGNPDPGCDAKHRDRKSHRRVRCRRCGETLWFPTGYSAQHRAPVLFCRRCGAQTKLPGRNRWIWVVLAVLVFLAAWVVVIITWMREDALAP